jgi:hypothetical protein
LVYPSSSSSEIGGFGCSSNLGASFSAACLPAALNALVSFRNVDRAITRIRRVDERCQNRMIFMTTIYRQRFSVVDNDELEEVVSDEYSRIQEVSKLHNISIPAVQLADDPSQPLGHGVMQYGKLDFEMLVNMRRQRFNTRPSKQPLEASDSPHRMTIQGKIVHELHERLKMMSQLEQVQIEVGDGLITVSLHRRFCCERSTGSGSTFVAPVISF